MHRIGNSRPASHQPIVYQILLDAKGATVSLQAIARRLYGKQPTPSLCASVRCMIQRIREKETGRAEILSVPGRGYRLVRFGEPTPIDVPALLQEVRDLPNPERSLLTHNERVLVEFCQRLGRALEHLSEKQNGFQDRHQAWLDQVCADDATDMAERIARFGEEALELQQALGQTLEEAIQLAQYVHGRAVGEPAQEIGGAMTTLAGLASFAGFDMADCAEAELERVSTPAMMAKIREKRSKRHGRGPLPGIYEPDFLPGGQANAQSTEARS